MGQYEAMDHTAARPTQRETSEGDEEPEDRACWYESLIIHALAVILPY
jgi:hypothetical protein